MTNSLHAMRVLIPLLYSCLLFMGACLPDSDSQAEPGNFIPASTSACLKIHDVERFRSDFRNNSLLEAYRDAQPEQALYSVLEQVLPLEFPDGALLVLTVPDSSNTQNPPWLLLFEEEVTIPQDSLAQKAERPVRRLEILPDSSGLLSELVRGVRLISPSRTLLSQAQASNEADRQNLQRALRTANVRSAATLLLPAEATQPLSRFLTGAPGSAVPISGTKWSAFDLELRSDALLFQGMQVRPDSLWDQEKLLRGVPVLPLQENLRVVPSDATALFSFSLQAPEKFLANQQNLLARGNPHQNLVEAVEHLSLLEMDTAKLTILSTLNPEVFEEAFRPFRSDLPSFQGVSLYSLEENNLLKSAFEPLLNRQPQAAYYAQLQQYLIFSEKLDALQNLISAFTREDTFANTARYKQLGQFLASESSALAISLNPKRSDYLSDSLSILGISPGIASRLPEDYLYAGQLNSSEDYDLLEYQFRKKEDPSGSGRSVAAVFTQKLDGQVLSGPFFLKNHNSGRMDIAVQDDQNQLYLFSDTGKLFWKKTLNGPIQGRIEQVDLFKNGRLQMAFTTPEALYVLDRNSNPVAPFPKEFPGGNIGPLAVFDYDKKLNYRLVFSQGQKIYMLDGQGRDVRGFKFRDAGSPVVGAPKHIRIGRRDYLIFRQEDGRLRILNRVGDTRVGVQQRFDFSGNGVFLYRNGFAFTEKNGNLVTIDPNGKVTRTPLNLNPDHGMYATAKTLSVMNDNEFRVRENRTELNLGVYTAPKMFYLYDIIYVAVTDIQSQQLYLFRSNAAAVSGFPVEGNGLPDMADTDGDRNPELAVRFRDSAIALYRIQR